MRARAMTISYSLKQMGSDPIFYNLPNARSRPSVSQGT
jgi:hypothetical protein